MRIAVILEEIMNKHRHDWAKRDKKEIVLTIIVSVIGALLIGAMLVVAPAFDQVIIEMKGH
jgi:flagellar basal body-associated protein FliL